MCKWNRLLVVLSNTQFHEPCARVLDSRLEPFTGTPSGSMRVSVSFVFLNTQCLPLQACSTVYERHSSIVSCGRSV